MLPHLLSSSPFHRLVFIWENKYKLMSYFIVIKSIVLMKSQLSTKIFPKGNSNCREFWICTEIPTPSILIPKGGRFPIGSREYKMLLLMMPGVIFEVVPLLMPLPLLSAVPTSANLPLESIRILLE